jgi:hypothetical protein
MLTADKTKLIEYEFNGWLKNNPTANPVQKQRTLQALMNKYMSGGTLTSPPRPGTGIPGSVHVGTPTGPLPAEEAKAMETPPRPGKVTFSTNSPNNPNNQPGSTFQGTLATPGYRERAVESFWPEANKFVKESQGRGEGYAQTWKGYGEDAEQATSATGIQNQMDVNRRFYGQDTTDNERISTQTYKDLENKSKGWFDDAQRDLERTGNSWQTNRDLQGYFRGNTIGDEYSYFQQGLRGPSRSEAAIDSGTGENALSTYYGRQSSEATRKLNQALAARGLLSSGAAMRAQQEQDRGIEANMSKDWLSLLSQADTQQRAREAGALDWKTSEAGDLGKRAELRSLSAQRTDEQQRLLAGQRGTLAQQQAEIEDMRARGLLDVDKQTSDRLTAGLTGEVTTANTTADLFKKKGEAIAAAQTGEEAGKSLFLKNLKELTDIGAQADQGLGDRVTGSVSILERANAPVVKAFQDATNAIFTGDVGMFSDYVNTIYTSGAISKQQSDYLINMMKNATDAAGKLAVQRELAKMEAENKKKQASGAPPGAATAADQARVEGTMNKGDEALNLKLKDPTETKPSSLTFQPLPPSEESYWDMKNIGNRYRTR